MRKEVCAWLSEDIWRSRAARFLCAVGILLLWCSAALGQTTFGSIAGSVSDPTGAIIPGAEITLTNLGTTEKRVAPSNTDGLYQFVNLVPGRYRIDSKKRGSSISSVNRSWWKCKTS